VGVPRRGVMAAGHPVVCEAAGAVLREGGSAFDAVVAAGFAACVAEPMFTSLGGGGFLLTRDAAGRAGLFDFFVDTPGRGLPAAALEPHFVPVTVRFPASEQVFNVGRGSAAVPGTLAGLLHAQEALGRLPLAAVVAPAARLAREGVPLNAIQAYALRLLEPIHTASAAGRALYTPEGRLPAEGERLVNRDLAAFLEALPGSARDLYGGALAERLADDMRSAGGLLTAQDLAAYRVLRRRPASAGYRGHVLLTNPRPSFGGTLVLLLLGILEGCALSPGDFGTPDHLRALVTAMAETDALRKEALARGDGPGPERVREAASRVRRASGGTTHVSIADAEGNVASLSLSNGEGSGCVVPGTGIMLNNMLGEDDLHEAGFHAAPPGERVASMMAPSLLLRDGAVRLILGSGGSKRIRTAMAQVVSNAVDFGMGVRAAVEAPRLHWDGELVQAEPGFAPAALRAVAGSWPTNAWEERNLYFGGVHAADPEGAAAGDPRRGGSGLVL